MGEVRVSRVAVGQLLRTRHICHQRQRKMVEEIITPIFPNLIHSIKPEHEKQEENDTRARHNPNPENQ